jgi:hypothetical protein
MVIAYLCCALWNESAPASPGHSAPVGDAGRRRIFEPDLVVVAPRRDLHPVTERVALIRALAVGRLRFGERQTGVVRAGEVEAGGCPEEHDRCLDHLSPARRFLEGIAEGSPCEIRISEIAGWDEIPGCEIGRRREIRSGEIDRCIQIG